MKFSEFKRLPMEEKDLFIEQYAKTLKEDETANTCCVRIFECCKCHWGYNDIYVSDRRETVEEDEAMYPNYCAWCGRKVVDFEFDDDE